jgi:hypothetical protein
MLAFFQAVYVPDRCFLSEALLWVAFQRLPIARYNDDAREIRETIEDEDYEIDTPDGPLTEDECRRAGIPPDPKFLRLVNDPGLVQRYKELEPRYGHDEAMRRINEPDPEEEEKFRRACAEWKPYYDQAIEYPASRIFVALRDGRLRASGRLLPSTNPEEAIASLQAEDRYVPELPFTVIPSSFWTLKGIHFEISAAQDAKEHYCHVMLRTDDLLSVFPGERQEIAVERIGDTLVVNESQKQKNRSKALRGRPAYPWERFHVEVSALLQRSELPAKKEAAIQHFQSWFERELDLRPSRAAIGEKLTPYYERFLRGCGQKI